MKLEGITRDAAWAGGGLALALICYFIGGAMGRSASLERAALAELTKEKIATDAAYQRSSRSLNETADKLRANKVRLSKLDGYEVRTAELQAQISSRQRELASTGEKLADKRGELESLTGKVEKVRRAPIELPAGQFTVGQDIRPGRFTVTGDSNFVVRSSEGEIKVNTILGGGEIGVEQYVCKLEEGDEIEASGADSFYPMD